MDRKGKKPVPPQRLIRNDCSSRETRSWGCTANLRHNRQGGSSARFRAHKIVHTQPLRSARDRGYRQTTPVRPDDRGEDSLTMLLLLQQLVRSSPVSVVF
jgi:hypothetical protein